VTDIDLMTDTQVAFMTVLAVGLWTGLAWTLWRRNRPRRARRTYQQPQQLHVDVTLGLPSRRSLRQATRQAKQHLNIRDK